MNRLWYNLHNFPSAIFANYDFIISYIKRPGYSWICTIKNSAIMSDGVHQWLHHRGLKFSRCLIFYRHNIDDHTTPHVDFEKFADDGSIIFSSAGINIELYGEGQVEFFDGNPSSGAYNVTPTGQPYISFLDHLCGDVIGKLDYEINSPVIIRTDVIHRVQCTVAPRMLVSIRFTKNDSELTWDETLKIFSDSLD
jgi:hypothetical protein